MSSCEWRALVAVTGERQDLCSMHHRFPYLLTCVVCLHGTFRGRVFLTKPCQLARWNPARLAMFLYIVCGNLANVCLSICHCFRNLWKRGHLNHTRSGLILRENWKSLFAIWDWAQCQRFAPWHCLLASGWGAICSWQSGVNVWLTTELYPVGKLLRGGQF